MSLTVSEIVTRVRSAIDELSLRGTDFANLNSDEQNLDKIIIDKIPYGLLFVLENAATDKFDTSTLQSGVGSGTGAGSFTLGSDLVGRLKLPANLLRIIEARLSSWTYFPIPELDSSQVALMQSDDYAKGSWDRPVNIFTYEGADRYLYMYCGKSGDTLKFTWIAKPDLTNVDYEHPTTSVAIPDKLEAALIYQIAGLTMLAFREDIAGQLFAVAKQYMGLNVDEQ